MEVDKVLGYKFPPASFTFTSKETILYALGIGAYKDPSDPSELPFVYENSPDFASLPTMGVIFPFHMLMELISVPGLNVNPMMILHGGQELIVHKAIPTSGTLTSQGYVKNVYDKGKGALIIIESETCDEQGDKIVTNRFSIFARGIGGFGGERGPSVVNVIPDTKPDFVHEQRTEPNQAVLYRLSGDSNPLHIDPQMAAVGGFQTPILHGLCSFGYAGRAIVKHCCDNDPAKFKSIDARFAAHIFPGETIVTEMWKVSPTKVVFQCKCKERGTIIIANGQIGLDGQGGAGGEESGSNLKSEVVFDDLKARVASGGEQVVKQVKGVYQFNVTGSDDQVHSWTVDLKNGAGSVSKGKHDKPDCTISMKDEDFVAVFTGKVNPQQAFMQGKLKIQGNMGMAMKLDVLMKASAKL